MIEVGALAGVAHLVPFTCGLWGCAALARGQRVATCR
jgi:hypothetical protein